MQRLLLKSKVNKGKILALDFGEKNVGMAETDAGRMIVFPAGVLSKFNSIKELGEKIGKICMKKSIAVVVFGLPMGEEGEETAQTERYREIGKSINTELLMNNVNVEFIFIDESFSSYEGEKMGGSATGHEKAAIKILERYLEVI